MSSRIFKSGDSSAEFSTDLGKFYTDFLNEVAPNASKLINDSLDKIEIEAKADWPKRKPLIRKDQSGRITFFRKLSKNSWNKWQRGTKIDALGNITVFLKNTAPYSWAIRFGVDSDNHNGQHILQPAGKKAAQILLIRPMRRASKKIVQALADDLMKRV
tara:strand:+ start:1672 stop:2148 length:477 start_codon:yes stop_codon:yes gene_type:complete